MENGVPKEKMYIYNNILLILIYVVLGGWIISRGVTLGSTISTVLLAIAFIFGIAGRFAAIRQYKRQPIGTRRSVDDLLRVGPPISLSHPKYLNMVLIFILANFVAVMSSKPLMIISQSFVIPVEMQLVVTSPAEATNATTWFTLALCACANLAAAGGCFFRVYPQIDRWSVMLLSIMLGSLLAVVIKTLQFQQAVPMANRLGFAPEVFLEHLALYSIPLTGFAAGLVTVGILLRMKGSNHVTPTGNSGI